MSDYAVVVMHPYNTEAQRLDFSSKEVDGLDGIKAALDELFAVAAETKTKWRIVHIVRIEDLPLLMEPPEGMAGSPS